LRATNNDQHRVADCLRDRAKEFNSRVLASVAEHVLEDPFVKVKKMIKDLLVRLTDERSERGSRTQRLV